MALVAILHVCSWLLLATGIFQVVVSKMGDFRYVRHETRALNSPHRCMLPTQGN